jgi:type II secretory pathway predicted ATPase ExeA
MRRALAWHWPRHRRRRLPQNHDVQALGGEPAYGLVPRALRVDDHQEHHALVQVHRVGARLARRTKSRWPLKQIRSEVSRLCAENRLRPVPIVDEAHHLRTDLLEDLRLLTNYAMDSENRLTLVLVGHPELRRRMSMAALDALAQRIVVRTNVRGLTGDEMGPYLAHRLELAGCELPLFESATVEAI